MDEQTWLSCTDPKDMLTHVGVKPQRKLRLFACACCYRIWDLITDDRCRDAVVVAERFADGLAKEKERAGAEHHAGQVLEELEPEDLDEELSPTVELKLRTKSAPFQAAGFAVELSGQVAWNGAGWAADALGYLAMKGNPRATARRAETRRKEEVVQCDLLRDIFGNPFRKVRVSAKWLTPKVVKFAHSIYDEGAFDRLSELAEALEAVGCDNADLLSHLRSDGPHVKGCWALDLVLGKS